MMKYLHFVTLFLLIGLQLALIPLKGNPYTQKVSLKSVYHSPAISWEKEALPIGNGYMGAMIFGGVGVDIIQINEKSLWSGGPGANPDYNGGHVRTAVDNRENLQNARKILQDKMNDFSANKSAYIDDEGKVITHNYTSEDPELKSYIQGLMGERSSFGSYQSLGNIHIAYPEFVKTDIVNITSNVASSTPLESAGMLFNEDSSTKWYAGHNCKELPCSVEWEYEENLPLTKYSVVSAKDRKERDPEEWKLYGSVDGKAYILIDHQKEVSFEHRREKKEFLLAEEFSFRFYKLEIIKVCKEENAPQLGQLILGEDHESYIDYTNYLRTLDIDQAITTVSYQENGVNYHREYFMSYPDRLMVIRLTADKTNGLSRVFWISSPQVNATIEAENGVITMTGVPFGHSEDGLQFAQQLRIIPTGGTMRQNKDKIIVENADEILLLMSAATNYQQCMDDTFNYFSSEDPSSIVSDILQEAARKGYQELLARHVEDYTSLYNRMSLVLGDNLDPLSTPTDQLLSEYGHKNSAEEDRYLEMLYFQFGRYLLISSSRPNTLPANLQGVWAEGLTPPWNSDYHTNINLQMNYWLAQSTNLGDCHLPMIDYVNSLVPRGSQTAKHYYCKQDGSDVRGWVIHHENNIWGNTAPGTYYSAFYFPVAAGWICQDIWEYYLFNSDIAFLEKQYETLLDAALFWVDNLWEDERDGKLVVNPSFSPEHGHYSLGTSADQAIVYELFDMVLKASQVLGKDIPEMKEIENAMNRLAGPKIGLAGQFMEWKDEITMDVTGDRGHRHVNHLHWLHPGSQIVPGRSEKESQFAEAMKKTLYTRGDGGTGWSKAWKINFWARLQDGEHAYKMVTEILKQSTLPNLFDTHPPFQIDGNFGSTAGMAEMLVQSHGGYIHLFPALPSQWNTGKLSGVKARGNFELNIDWKEGELEALEIISNAGNDCVLKYKNIAYYSLEEDMGNEIEFQKIANDCIAFATITGKNYWLRTK